MMNKNLIALSGAALIALGASSSWAESETVSSELEPGTVISEEYIWRLDTPEYEFKHPMKVTCEDFLDTDQVYRPYVVAWLNGRSVGVTDISDPDEFVPVSVPQMVRLCKEEPDTLVWELIQVQ